MATPEQAIDTVAERTHQKQGARRLWQATGAIKLANQVANALGSQALHALETIRDEKLYLSEGYDTFDRFLDKDPDSPMSHDTFLRRVKLLKNEGEVVFDLLNSLNVPFNQRKLLAGNVEVDGNELRIGDATCRLDDEVAIIDLISTQHSKLLEQQRTIERGKKDIEKHKRRADEAEKRAVVANPDATETGQALLTAAGAIKNLRERLEAASVEEKRALQEEIFELFRKGMLDCSEALGVASKEEIAAAKGGDDDLLAD